MAVKALTAFPPFFSPTAIIINSFLRSVYLYTAYKNISAAYIVPIIDMIYRPHFIILIVGNAYEKKEVVTEKVSK